MNQSIQDKSENQLGQQYRNNIEVQLHVKFMVEDIILLLIVVAGLLLVPI